MDTGIIVLIVVVVVLLIALLVARPRLKAAREEKRLQSQRQEVADRHHAEADQKLAHAEQIEHSAEAERAEAELAERQAAARRAEVETAERKAEAARAEANVSRSAASRTEQGLADDQIDGSGDDRRTETVREVREVDPRDGDLRDDRTASRDPEVRRGRPV